MLGLFAQQLGIGLVAGVAIGWLATRAFQSVRLSSPGLYPVASLATAALAFGAADTLGGSGFLAVLPRRARARLGRTSRPSAP